ncbi:HAD family hydrolase [Oerskovia turbata]|uniref:HAD family hydrolase n=1 Tax=Oerskovia turbata TaxID=1713 RepID=A0A4Q1L3I2_9CELL|nr:HAD family hydrolase [Oerskovia turbata]RXR27063.1 HAD family hydrolase [Oerskovia turbata]RXR36369.1 HAD family hydrolase [Oerskovia turbata]TGJ95471.1 HAD family hydrolase [Actinotalea fermentans ATCC 43279 = JCM 9966 = DSM 3133]
MAALVLDLDGTLVDHVGSARAALAAWLPGLGVEVTDELVTAWFAAEEKHFRAWRSREISFAEQRRRRLRDVLPLTGLDTSVDLGSDAELDGVFVGYASHYEASWTAFDDVEPMLAALSDLPVRLAVLTNGTDEQQHAKLGAVGLAGRLGPVFTAERLGVAKPEPRSYLRVCTALGVAPGDVLHVGDRYDLDVVAARAAGLRAVHLDRTGQGPHDEPARITSLAELVLRVGA